MVVMGIKTIDDLAVKGKYVLLRSDLNSELAKGKAILGPRIIESAKSIEDLIDRKARVVVIAHQGRKGKDDFTDLREHAKILNKYVKIGFVNDVIGKEAVSAVKKLKDGEAILLDNVRSLDEELKIDVQNVFGNIIVKTLAPLFDIYVNDAFSVSHREQTSIVGFPRAISEVGIGRVMQRELESLARLGSLDDCLYILGGSKPEDNIKLMKRKKILACGIFGHVCLTASGVELGAQRKYLESQGKLELAGQLKPLVKRKGVEMPVDLVVNKKGKAANLKISEFPSEYEVFDIGTETRKRFVEEIKKSKTVYMKGTAGFCEEEQFCNGTKAILSAIVNSGAYSILGGGHATTALRKFGIDESKIGYVSLSGGALVAYLAGEKLPGIEALKKK